MIGVITRALRRRLPKRLRERIALSRRKLRDRLSGVERQIVSAPRFHARPEDLVEALRITQPIRRSDHWEGKLENLQIAVRLMNGLILPPGRILSLSALIGRPTSERGFKIGRAIRGNILDSEVGGGLCQASGLVYELGLRAGLTIVERHAHSWDLYTEATRFTPLGLDATIVWGHKDLRLRNDLGHPVVFAFDLAHGEICGRIHAAQPMEIARIEIERREQDDERRVCVRRVRGLGDAELVSADVYRLNVSAPR
ncbi:MAG: VanW family protein [Roseiarcus sp.]|jgi:vancomycin resistance protein VanW